MINIAIAGWGNIGRGVNTAIPRHPDIKLVAVFTRRPEAVKKDVKTVPVLQTEKFTLPKDMRIDVVVLCGGSKDDVPVQGPLFARQFNTVDSFDTHADIPAYFKKMDGIARENGHVSIFSAGWDPGIFSIERVLHDAFLPEAKRYTFWGPGVSQGHSDAARTIKGVLDARQYTIPIDSALEQVRSGQTPEFTKRQMHRRVVYMVAEAGADKERIKKDLVGMPKYYDEYDTEVIFITAAEMKQKHATYPHGGFVLTSGTTGRNNRQIQEYRCQLGSNPEFTGSVLVACARAAFRLKESGRTGAFSMVDVPPALFSPHSAEVLRNKFI